MRELQQFLNERQANIFFGPDHHGEIWVSGERIGAITHNEDAELIEFHCDC